ncbi:MAG: membrane protein insertion efficiency factor YidD [Candidatus Woesearchaeota archaeon]|nr:membrane protein insertion efficiency factor YidD [Candidatus Woesearchaeota archaeon]
MDDAVKSAQPDAFLLRQIENYQKNISPKIKETLGKDRLCKFEPSCSEYSKQAIEKYGSMKGALISINRLLRCNPISKGGADPLK